MPSERRARLLVVLAMGALAPCAAHCSLLVDTAGLEGSGAPPDAPSSVDAEPSSEADASPEADPPFELDASLEEASPGDASVEDTGSRPSYVETVLADGPVLFYRLEESSGSTARDEVSGTSGSYFGSVGRAVPGISANSRAIELDGSASGVDLGAGFDFDGRLPYSVEVWYRVAANEPEFRFLVSKLAGGASGRDSYGLYVHSDYGLVFERWISGALVSVGAGLPPLDGQYHQAVGVYDGSSLKVYRDGVLAGSNADERNANPKPAPLRIGSFDGTKTFAFLGRIDEVAIYAKALAPERILAHYEARHR